VDAIECETLSLQDWLAVTGRDPSAFGAAGSRLAWRPKDRYVVVRDAGGHLAATGGVVRAAVAVAGGEPFDVAGIGGVVVAQAFRERGLMTQVMSAVRAMADRLGPDHAMIFCNPELEGLYHRRGYTTIAEPVTVDQPGGPIRMPLVALHRPIRAGAVWPAGPVAVDGLPF
jgi:GNAT superfamily N-acetyltransferase